VGRDLLGAEAVDDVREEVAVLVGVAGEHNLGALTCARADGLDLVGTEVLGIVDDPVLRRDRTTADVGERFDLHDAEVDELLVAAAALLLLRRPSHPEFDDVEDRLHPRIQLLLDLTRQVAEDFAHREDSAPNEPRCPMQPCSPATPRGGRSCRERPPERRRTRPPARR